VILKSVKELFLYAVGLLGVVAAGVAFLQSRTLATGAALVAAFSVLITDYLWLSKKRLTRKDLEEKRIDELISIARDRKLKNYSDATKADLINLLLEDMKQQGDLHSPRWTIAKWGLFASGVALIFLINHYYPNIKSLQPKYRLAWYQETNGRLSLVDPSKINRTLTADDIYSNRLHVPINLAIRNEDKVPLEVVRVELTYPKKLGEVRSAGKARIDPANRKLVYEHYIGTLENVGEFTPLQSVDVIEIPFRSRFKTLTEESHRA
jgi:Rho termination factor, N-terminal domain